MLAKTNELTLLRSEKLKRNSKPRLTNLADFGQTCPPGERENDIVLCEDTFRDSPGEVVINDPHFSVSDLGDNCNLKTECGSQSLPLPPSVRATDGSGVKRDAFDKEQHKNEIVIYDIDVASDVPVRLHAHRNSPHQDGFRKIEINQVLDLGIVGETFGKDLHSHLEGWKEKVGHHPKARSLFIEKREMRERSL